MGVMALNDVDYRTWSVILWSLFNLYLVSTSSYWKMLRYDVVMDETNSSWLMSCIACRGGALKLKRGEYGLSDWWLPCICRLVLSALDRERYSRGLKFKYAAWLVDKSGVGSGMSYVQGLTVFIQKLKNNVKKLGGWSHVVSVHLLITCYDKDLLNS